MEWCKEDVRILAKEDIYIEKSSCDVHAYIADVNRLIAERINTIRNLFPEWLNWEYVKSLFLMPKGQNIKSIHKESLKFSCNRSLYPYKKYINWDPYDVGNILISDSKFAKILYDINDDYFDDYSKVLDAKESDVKNIYDFINESDSVQLFVDCENSDVFKLASVLKQLDSTETQKIDKIVLYDGVYTSSAWRYLELITDIPVEYVATERVKAEKSLVDVKLTMGISQAYYRDNISSFILLSSDSDFWGVISSMPDAGFLVMAERSKCGPDLQKKLEENKIFYCFIDDFCSANITSFKEDVISIAFEDEMDKLLEANAKAIMDQIYHQLWIDASEIEKQSIYNKLIKKLTLNIDKDANMRIRLSA
ncbi:MAG: NYN domain-containing protein [Ruminococcus sp.]|nr:NYN domain-containing protein [Ruminococcus sp.]